MRFKLLKSDYKHRVLRACLFFSVVKQNERRKG